MFINPMWDHESQRIGKLKCTPVGYMIHVISDLVGLVAMICLTGIPIFLVYAALRGTFFWAQLWLLAVPFVIAIIGSAMHSYSWDLAYDRQFEYDAETYISTWVDESGNQHSYQSKGDSDQRWD